MSFPVQPLDRYTKASLFRKPVELCSFSYDDQRLLHHDDRSLSFFWPADKDADLSVGYTDRYIRRDESVVEHLDGLLAAIVRYEEEHPEDRRTRDVDVVCWRGIVTRLLTLPYELHRQSKFQDGFELNATLLEGTLYLEDHVDDQTRLKKASREADPIQQRAMYWGYRYEGLSTIPRTWPHTTRGEIESRAAREVNTNVQYISVVRTRLGPVSLVLGGEVDCAIDYKPDPQPPIVATSDDEFVIRPPSATMYASEDPLGRYLELKTSKVIASPRDRSVFEESKLLKFWAQSFLLGVPRIRVGFRSRDGILVGEEEFETLKIPGLTHWDGNVCINFAGDALKWVIASIKKDNCHEGTWRLRYRPGGIGLEMFRVTDSGHGFLSDAFLRHRRFAN
ncbi:decapping endonuclease targeting mRNA [Savitreella phatthalungensis]